MEGSQGAEVAKDRAADDGLSDFCEQRIEEGGRVKRISRCNGRESSLICLLILSYRRDTHEFMYEKSVGY